MHARLYNEATFRLTLRPQTPLLIKSGRSGDDALDPTLPDMSFVRTLRSGASDEEILVPGASLRGVVRSHAEKLVRSINDYQACDPTNIQGKGRLEQACGNNKRRMEIKKTDRLDKLTGPEAYNRSCYVCRLFGSTVMASRVRVGDMNLDPARSPLLERRYGVAIDRITGAVAQGPFEIETLTDATFNGQLNVRNFTLGQLGLLAAALLDLGDGLVPMGYGKSRGLGRVSLGFDLLNIRTLRDTGGEVWGVGKLVNEKDRTDYDLPDASQERIAITVDSQRNRGFYTWNLSGEAAKVWLDQVAGVWVREVEAQEGGP